MDQMEVVKFTEKLSKACEFEELGVTGVGPDTDLTGLECWDSLAALNVQLLADRDYNVSITATHIRGCKTPRDLYKVIFDLKR